MLLSCSGSDRQQEEYYLSLSVNFHWLFRRPLYCESKSPQLIGRESVGTGRDKFPRCLPWQAGSRGRPPIDFDELHSYR